MGVMRRERWVRIRGGRAHYGTHGQTHYETHFEGMRRLGRPWRRLNPIDSRAACAAARPFLFCAAFSLATFPKVNLLGWGAKGPDCYFSCNDCR